MLSKYYQFLDTINKKYDVTNDKVYVDKNNVMNYIKTETNNTFFTIMEENIIVRNESNRNEAKIDTNFVSGDFTNKKNLFK